MAAGDRCTKRIRKAAYSLYFDLGCNAMQIQREVCPTFSIRMVKTYLARHTTVQCRYKCV